MIRDYIIKQLHFFRKLIKLNKNIQLQKRLII